MMKFSEVLVIEAVIVGRRVRITIVAELVMIVQDHVLTRHVSLIHPWFLTLYIMHRHIAYFIYRHRNLKLNFYLIINNNDIFILMYEIK